MAILKRTLRAGLDALAGMGSMGLRSRCPACGDPVGPEGRGHAHGLCPACATALAPRLGGYCPRCGLRFGLESYEPEVCGDCLDHPPPWERLAFHGVYDGQLRELILAFKFVSGLGHLALLQGLALDAAERAGMLRGEERPQVVAPVPLHPNRLRWRGYNQCLELARPLAKRLDAALAPKALARVRDTTPQTMLSGTERLGNLAGAFRADPALMAGRRVLLVDDVSTTGTTLMECVRELKARGAARVDVLVLART